jgi:predicted RNA binding protein YcfA (HicA-like mRNA interferase family)
VSGRQTIRVLTKAGFRIVGRKGSHVRLKKKDGRTLIVIVPDHKELARGTLSSILRQANLSREQFIALLKSES